MNTHEGKGSKLLVCKEYKIINFLISHERLVFMTKRYLIFCVSVLFMTT